MSVFLQNDELSKLQELNNKFNSLKMKLGDLELSKQAVIDDINSVKIEFSKNEFALVSKYGKDAVINLQTGEVTKKD
jgi:hypothetical protein